MIRNTLGTTETQTPQASPRRPTATEMGRTKGATSSLVLPLILATLFSVPLMASAENGPRAGQKTESEVESVMTLTTLAQAKDPDAMYWLAMLHIEGKIDNASYDKGVQLLGEAADAGQPEAERIRSFMENAFSGDGC